jgi:tetrahydromethanopterin S-methyltransferase subunit G
MIGLSGGEVDICGNTINVASSGAININGNGTFSVNSTSGMKLTSITSSIKNNVLYYDTSTNAVSYGLAASSTLNAISGNTTSNVVLYNPGTSSQTYSSNFIQKVNGATIYTGIGNSSPNYTLDVGGSAKISGNVGVGGAETSAMYSLNVLGSIYASGDIVGLSDIRAKKDVETIDDALDKVKKMRGVYYTMRETDKRCIGLIAQETQQILPEVVTSDTSGNNIGIAYGNIVGLLVEAIKDSDKEMKLLREKNETLVSQNNMLEKRLSALESIIHGGSA